ncbi:hypothetical protein diail_3526 [Diaporthe ilicicola]|nr:hypothetical protein diail_3526 [Diaporthe ilicicola]
MGSEASKRVHELKAKAKSSKTQNKNAGAVSRTTPAGSATPAAPAKPAATANNVAAPITAITTSPMDKATMDEMMAAVAAAVPGKADYRVIGGVAMAKFGSGRRTKDLDLLVPNNTIAAVVQKVLATGKFGAEKRSGGSYQVWFKSSNGNNYNVDIMGPAQIHSTFTYPSSCVTVGGTQILAPSQLLNMKILAYQIRKKTTDAEDIVHLVKWMAQNGMKTSPAEVTYADPDFLQMFTVQKYASTKNSWIAIGLPPP